MIRNLDRCIVCKGELSKVGYLGNLYPSKFVTSPEEKANYEPTETWINWCDKCKNMQAPRVKDGEELFREYYYNSGINASMRASLLDIVNCKYAQDTYIFCDDDDFSWLDIAANDCTMCEQIKEEYPDAFVVGIDPSRIENRKSTDIFINDFFSLKAVQEKVNSKFDVISCIAMFYDLEKPHEFIDDVKSLLKDDGLFIVQLMDLESQLKTYAIDNVCEEHLVCYSLQCLKTLFSEHGLEIFDCEYNKTNCSSLRIYVGFPDQHEVQEIVDQLILFQSEGLNKTNMLYWEEKLGRKLKSFRQYLDVQKALKKDIYLIGASTKASTLLQLCNITSNLVTSALEKSSFKWGRFMMESGIPIVSEDEFLKEERDWSNVVFVLAIWAFKEGILKTYQKYIDLGATICVPLPIPIIITKDGEKTI